MPRVAGTSVFGALGELLRDHYAALQRWQRDYGGVFRLELGPSSFVIAADASSAAEMLIEHGQEITREGSIYEPLKAVFGERSMLIAEGSVWRDRRRTAQPHFRQRAIAALGPRVHASVVDTLTQATPGPEEIYALCGKVAMRVGLSVLFGQDLARDEFIPLARAIDYAIGRIAVGWVSSRLPRWVPIPGARRFRREIALIDDVLGRLIRARLASGEFGDDMLGMLLHMAEVGGMSPEEVRDEAVTLLIAGYETTGNAMAWALYELARHPEFAARVRTEADTMGPDGVADPKRLPFTRRVFKESMRMYPSGIWLPRTATAATTIGGYPIDAGTPVVCSAYLVHHDPHAWVDPARFDPDRFLDGSDQPRSRFAYMPFGLGQHMCIGQHLAMLEGTATIARFVRSWDLAPIPERLPQPRVGTTMTTKDGIWVELRRRT